MLLALDISTSIIGWSVFNEKAALVAYGSIKIKKSLSLLEKADFAFNEMEKTILSVYEIDNFAVEEALQKFTNGKSTAKTINTLVSFNFCICFQIWKSTGMNPHYIPVITARKSCGIVIPKKPKLSYKQKKEIVRQFCEKNHPDVKWKKNKLGNVSVECFDIADSIVIGEAVCKILTKEQK